MPRCSLSVCPVILMWAYSRSSSMEVPSWWFSMIHVYLQWQELAWDSKLSSMRFGYSYFTGHEVFNLWFVNHMLHNCTRINFNHSRYGDPDLPSRIPVMHTIHDPRKTIMNPHNKVGITEYIIHYINKSISLTWLLSQIQMPRKASSLSIAAETKVASVAHVTPLPYRRLTGRWILVRTGVVELLTIIIVILIIIWPS
jgi:hypothetical protein